LEKNTYNIGKEYLYWKRILIILEKNTYNIGKEYLYWKVSFLNEKENLIENNP